MHDEASMHGVERPNPVPGAPNGFECRLDSTQTFTTLLSSLQLGKEKDQRIHCEVSGKGLKFTSHTQAKDCVVTGWMFGAAFQEFKYTAATDILELRLPLSPLISCLQIFSSHAALLLRYRPNEAEELRLTLEEDGAVTECHVKTLFMQEELPEVPFLGAGDTLQMFRVSPEAWYAALGEFHDMDTGSGAELRLTVRPSDDPHAEVAAVSLRATGMMGETEVELPWRPGSGGPLEGLEVDKQATHRYRLQSVLCGKLAASNSTAVKMRLNPQGMMSMQCILKARSSQHIFCEVLVVPLTGDAANAGPGPLPKASANGGVEQQESAYF